MFDLPGSVAPILASSLSSVYDLDYEHVEERARGRNVLSSKQKIQKQTKPHLQGTAFLAGNKHIAHRE